VDTPREDGTLIALMHSELSEALEALRKNEGGERVAEELADVVIRIIDYAQYNGLDIANAMIYKAEKNEGRSHKHGGKQF
jgi:NTP pyrophosphatase (non-canonical NTP hydrolase)